MNAHRLGLGIALLLGAPVFLGCQDDACEDEPPSLQLDVAAPMEVRDAASLTISLSYGSIRIRKDFDLSGALSDGQTSFAIELTPPPTASFELLVQVEARGGAGGTGTVLGRGEARNEFTPDGCNRFNVSLMAVAPVDGGVDGGADAGILDGQLQDADTSEAGTDGGVDDVGAMDVPAGGDAMPNADAEPADVPVVDTGCVPEVVADGVDQNCDGFDDCYLDGDNDGHGIPTVVTDTNLDCTDMSALTATTTTDCNDADNNIYPTTACTDNDAATLNDLCFPGACLGRNTSGCAGTCPSAGGCCEENCATCNTCTAGSACGYVCTGLTCDATCNGGSICDANLDPGGAGMATGTLACESGASCSMSCRAAQNRNVTCTLDCPTGAFCILESCRETGNGVAACSVICPSGEITTCPGGEIVCNRGCPL